MKSLSQLSGCTKLEKGKAMGLLREVRGGVRETNVAFESLGSASKRSVQKRPVISFCP